MKKSSKIGREHKDLIKSSALILDAITKAFFWNDGYVSGSIPTKFDLYLRFLKILKF